MAKSKKQPLDYYLPYQVGDTVTDKEHGEGTVIDPTQHYSPDIEETYPEMWIALKQGCIFVKFGVFTWWVHRDNIIKHIKNNKQ